MYDFDQVIDRRETNSLKWDVAEHELPMWVADMDFRTAPEILAAVQKRLDHGVFGYNILPERWAGAYCGWWKERYGFAMEKEWLLFCSGVVPAISSIIRCLSGPGQSVVLQTPVYNAFFGCIRDNGRSVLENPLRYEEGVYSMDLEDLEEKLKDPSTALLILCNPHNPAGRIWSREDLAKIGTLARQYRVPVIADEIHCDLTAPGLTYTPFAAVSEDCRAVSINCLAPTKTFNLAGMQTAAVCIPDPEIREKVKRALKLDGLAEPNAFAIPAAIAAYEEGAPWLEALRTYVFGNKQLAADFLKSELSEVFVSGGEATYLLWLDVSAFSARSDVIARALRKETGLFVTAGTAYGAAGGSFLRMNVACPRSVCRDGLDRLRAGLSKMR